jgi:hypothetical protein
LTFPAREALPVATLPPAQLSGSFDDSSPPTTSDIVAKFKFVFVGNYGQFATILVETHKINVNEAMSRHLMVICLTDSLKNEVKNVRTGIL